MRKLFFLLLSACLFAPLAAQDLDAAPKWRVGLELYDLMHQTLHIRGSYRPHKSLELAGSLGYCLGRKYPYLGSLVDQVHGPFGSIGLHWRIEPQVHGAWLLGGFITMGYARHRAKATIPNYYGDVVENHVFETGYVGLQGMLARSIIWQNWQLDLGLRLSTCQRQYKEVAFHSFQPGIGRANMWAVRYSQTPSLLLRPLLNLSYCF
jgi:hypothetical protein